MMSLIELFIALVLLVLPLIAMVDILRSRFGGNDKLIWVLVVIFLPVLGSLLYFLMGTKRKIK